jgi:hypothetical protein
MGKTHDVIDERLRAFIESQHVFFVATAPLSETGHVNVSPKGLDSLRVLGPNEVAYLDFVGSGAETIAHLRENGRITVMLCAFEGAPKIVRLHGRGEVVEPGGAAFAELRRSFPPGTEGRSIIRIAVERVTESCGFGVPLYALEGSRTQLPAWAERKGEEGLRAYQLEKNVRSIDGLPALRWVAGNERP